MFLSCKISNATITHLESQGADWTPVFDKIKSSPSLLRDPSYWADADELEEFLREVSERFRGNETAEEWMMQIGAREYELRSWGVLDQVLRIMARPQEILAQPERFLAYFISPQPPVLNIERSENHIAFDLPLMPEEWPLITSYLRGALSSLPTFVGQPLAQVAWEGVRLQINWMGSQEAFFGMEEASRQLSPEMMKNLIHTLERSQKELEGRNRSLLTQFESLQKRKKVRPGEDISRLYTQMSHIREQSLEFSVPVEQALQNFQTLHDYFIRAQQLITILVGQNRVTPAVQEAMRRLDWTNVTSGYGDLVASSMKSLYQLKETSQDLEAVADSMQFAEDKESSDPQLSLL